MAAPVPAARVILLPLSDNEVSGPAPCLSAHASPHGSHMLAAHVAAVARPAGPQLPSAVWYGDARIQLPQASDAALAFYLANVHRAGDFVQLLFGERAGAS